MFNFDEVHDELVELYAKARARPDSREWTALTGMFGQALGTLKTLDGHIRRLRNAAGWDIEQSGTVTFHKVGSDEESQEQ